MENFTPYSALTGGALIGTASALMLLLAGRITGISSIVGGLLGGSGEERGWRLAFVVGLMLGVAAYAALGGGLEQITIEADYLLLAAGGLLVGFGTRLGGGCTSGHGVCGLSRLSRRSLVATPTFIASAAVTVYVVRHVLGGGA